MFQVCLMFESGLRDQKKTTNSTNDFSQRPRRNTQVSKNSINIAETQVQ